jgi:xanthine dehydrogenase YagT iron-sulfur-binding subunit
VQVRTREWQQLVLLGPHVLPLETRVRLHRVAKRRKLACPAAAIALERLREVAHLLAARRMVDLEFRDDRPGLGAPFRHPRKQILVFARVMEALRKSVEVVEHRAEKLEIRVDASRTDFAHEVAHAVEDRGERAMFVEENRDGVHEGAGGNRTGEVRLDTTDKIVDLVPGVKSTAGSFGEGTWHAHGAHCRRAEQEEPAIGGAGLSSMDDAKCLTSGGRARRRFLCTTGALGVLLQAQGLVAAGDVPDAANASAPPARGAPVPVRLNVNGRDYVLSLEPRVTLLDALREYIGLTGTKKGCDRGQCGACTVLVNDRRINACLALAVAHQGDRVQTVEGLASASALHPVQAAFVEHDGFQCGYCTPGQICSAVALLREAREDTISAATSDVRRRGPFALDDAEIRERMSGNLCRCGAYVGIVAAVRDAASRSA